MKPGSWTDSAVSFALLALLWGVLAFGFLVVGPALVTTP